MNAKTVSDLLERVRAEKTRWKAIERLQTIQPQDVEAVPILDRAFETRIDSFATLPSTPLNGWESAEWEQ